MGDADSRREFGEPKAARFAQSPKFAAVYLHTGQFSSHSEKTIANISKLQALHAFCHECYKKQQQAPGFAHIQLHAAVRSWHSDDMPTRHPESTHAKRLAALATERRQNLGLSVNGAAREAGIDRGTWLRLEDGEKPISDSKWTPIERTLRWEKGSIRSVLAGSDPTPLAVGGGDYRRPEKVPVADTLERLHQLNREGRITSEVARLLLIAVEISENRS